MEDFEKFGDLINHSLFTDKEPQRFPVSREQDNYSRLSIKSEEGISLFRKSLSSYVISASRETWYVGLPNRGLVAAKVGKYTLDNWHICKSYYDYRAFKFTIVEYHEHIQRLFNLDEL